MHVLIFGLSGAVAGIGGTILSINQQAVNPELFSWSFSLVFVVVVVTTGVSTPEGAIQAGFGYVVLQQLLTYVPARLGGNSLLIVFFAFGALTYVSHPEGILEFQKRRWTLRMERLVLRGRATPNSSAPPGPGGGARGWPRRAWTRTLRWAADVAVSPSSVRAPADAGVLLRLDGVSKTFGGIAAVNAVSFEVDGGRAWGWSARTAPARRPCSTASAGSCAPSAAASSWTARPLRRHAHLPAGPAGHRPHLPAGRGLPRHDRAGPSAGGLAGPSPQRPAVAGPVQPVRAQRRGVDQGGRRARDGGARATGPTRRWRRSGWGRAAWWSWPGPWWPTRYS